MCYGVSFRKKWRAGPLIDNIDKAGNDEVIKTGGVMSWLN